MKVSMGKAEQVRYLGQHLRLLHAAQWGQPGGVDFEGKKSLPAGVNEDKTNIASLKINPYGELKHIVVQTEDLPLLLPFLDDQNYVLAYGYWRNFHPGRSLYRANDLVAGIINAVAKHPLVNPKIWNDQDNEKRQAYRSSIAKWCEDNKGKSRASQ